MMVKVCSHLPPECVVIEQLVSGEIPLLASPASPALCYLFSGAGSACLQSKKIPLCPTEIILAIYTPIGLRT